MHDVYIRSRLRVYSIIRTCMACVGQYQRNTLIEDDVPKPSGLFEPAQEDPVAAVVEHPVEGADAVAVTVEPEEGSPKPTSDPMLVAKV